MLQVNKLQICRKGSCWLKHCGCSVQVCDWQKMSKFPWRNTTESSHAPSASICSSLWDTRDCFKMDREARGDQRTLPHSADYPAGRRSHYSYSYILILEGCCHILLTDTCNSTSRNCKCSTALSHFLKFLLCISPLEQKFFPSCRNPEWL